MLQRKQSLYLLVVSVVSGVLSSMFSLWKEGENTVYIVDSLLYISVFIVIAVLALTSIFSYKNRMLQVKLGRFNIILNFILLGLFVYQSLSLSGETKVSEKGIGMLLPIFSIVFLALANKAIKKDEDLVKSVDRLR